ncbi:helix-turn-helix domain-containing protein [bacterium]|nr:helix-turn-helix domain-containing protein [bacterium]
MPWLTKKEAAEYLRVCENTIDNLESEGMLKGYRLYIGKKPIVRFKQEDLDNLFLKRQKGRPREEILLDKGGL